jgi:[ribosomal protein S5]-alanine N-acetyltransferase
MIYSSVQQQRYQRKPLIIKPMLPVVEIITPRLCLKPLQPQHLEAMRSLLNQPSVHTQVSIIPSESDAERSAFAETWVRQSSQTPMEGEYILGIFLNDESNRLVGNIGLHPTSNLYEAEVGYWLDEAFQRKGMMREALEALLHHAVTHTHYTSVMATCALQNRGSKQVLLGAGFHVVSQQHPVTLTDGSIRPSYLLRRTL